MTPFPPDITLSYCPETVRLNQSSRIVVSKDIPEVQIINAPLHISHVDIEAEQVHRRQRTTRQHLKQIRQPVAWAHAVHALRGWVVSHCDRLRGRGQCVYAAYEAW
nr:hypothetical protein CFP56_07937 [Quercus suber]